MGKNLLSLKRSSANADIGCTDGLEGYYESWQKEYFYCGAIVRVFDFLVMTILVQRRSICISCNSTNIGEQKLLLN